MNEFIAFGETLEDYVPGEDGKFIKLVGGAPLNLASEVASFGVKTHIITCLGKDLASQRVLDMIRREHIEEDMISFDPKSVLCHTEVAVDSKTGERKFTFFKDKASFLSLSENDIKEEYFSQGDVLHIGTVCLLGEKIIAAQKKACELALKKSMLITFDPNFRPSLFKKGVQERLALQFLPFADVLKLGEEEVKCFSPSAYDAGTGVIDLMKQFSNLKLVLLTLGAKGMELFIRGEVSPLMVPSVCPPKIVDTVGCGDSSFGAFIGFLTKEGYALRDGILKTPAYTLEKALKIASIAGSLVCGQKGALPMPEVSKLYSFAKERNIEL